MKYLLCSIILSLLLEASQAAVVVNTSIVSQEEYELAAGVASWRSLFQAGGDRGVLYSNEIEVEVSGLVTTGEHTWAWPEEIRVMYDNSGNLETSVGADMILDQPFANFDSIWIRIHDNGTLFGGSSLTGIFMDGLSITDLAVDEGDQYLRIDLLGDSPAFELTAVFDTDTLTAGGNGASVEFIGVDVPVRQEFVPLEVHATKGPMEAGLSSMYLYWSTGVSLSEFVISYSTDLLKWEFFDYGPANVFGNNPGEYSLQVFLDPGEPRKFFKVEGR